MYTYIHIPALQIRWRQLSLCVAAAAPPTSAVLRPAFIIYIYIYIYIYICLCVCMYVCMYVMYVMYVCTCVHVFMYVCM